MRRRIAQSLTGLVVALLAVFTFAGPASAIVTVVSITPDPPYSVGDLITITIKQTGPAVNPGDTTFLSFTLQGTCFADITIPGDVYPDGRLIRNLVLTAQVTSAVAATGTCATTSIEPAVEGNIVSPDPTVKDVTLTGPLPRTGSDTWREVWLGGILGVAGVAMVIVARRRARLYDID